MKNLKKALSLTVALTVLLCAGCSDIERGTVTGKHYKSSWVQTNMIMVGKVMVPQIINHPERWVVDIKEGDEHGYCYVSKSYYETIAVGDYLDCT